MEANHPSRAGVGVIIAAVLWRSDSVSPDVSQWVYAQRGTGTVAWMGLPLQKEQSQKTAVCNPPAQRFQLTRFQEEQT